MKNIAIEVALVSKDNRQVSNFVLVEINFKTLLSDDFTLIADRSVLLDNRLFFQYNGKTKSVINGDFLKDKFVTKHQKVHIGNNSRLDGKINWHESYRTLVP